MSSKPVRPSETRKTIIFRTQINFFEEIRELSDPSINSNVTDMFKTQKDSKDIIKIVHVLSGQSATLHVMLLTQEPPFWHNMAALSLVYKQRKTHAVHKTAFVTCL